MVALGAFSNEAKSLGLEFFWTKIKIQDLQTKLPVFKAQRLPVLPTRFFLSFKDTPAWKRLLARSRGSWLGQENQTFREEFEIGPNLPWWFAIRKLRWKRMMDPAPLISFKCDFLELFVNRNSNTYGDEAILPPSFNTSFQL